MEKRRKAADNLIVLTRERAGAEALHKDGVIQQIARLMKVEKDAKIRLSCIRCVSELVKRGEMCKAVLAACGIPFFLDILNTRDEETVNAVTLLIQRILDTLSHFHIAKEVKEKRKNPRAMSSEDRKWCIKQEEERAKIIKGVYKLYRMFRKPTVFKKKLRCFLTLQRARNWILSSKCWPSTARPEHSRERPETPSWN